MDDQCRACKVLREHIVVAANPDGTIAQVQCDFCGSRHRFHGGAARDVRPTTPRAPVAPPRPGTFLSDRERSSPVIETPADFETVLRRVIREETGLTPVTPAEKWRGGELVLRPGTAGLQEKSWPIDAFFHKIVMLRNRLRVLEQNVNALEIPEDVKLKLQSYITGCYGSLTSFNVLFANAEDRFQGTGGSD